MATPAEQFDPSTAVAAPDPAGFDPSTAVPVEGPPSNPAAIKPGSAEASSATHGERMGFHPFEHALYPDIDFDSGLPMLDGVHLAQADNMAEKVMYLQKVYGKDNVSTVDGPLGTPILVVKKDGKKIAAEAGSGFDNFVAHAIGSGPEWLGAGIGAALATPADVVTGPGGTMAGAGLGGGIGKEFIELGKQFSGNYHQTNSEAARNAIEAVVANSAGEGAGQILGKGLGRAMTGPLPKLVTGSTQEGDAFTDRLLEGGARPPAQSTMPSAKHLQYVEAKSAKLVGPVKAQDAANAAYIRKRVSGILADSGLNEEQVEAVLGDLEKGDSKVPTAEVGESVKQRAQAHKEMLEAGVTTQLGELQKIVDTDLAHLDALTRRYKPGDLGVDVAAGIQQARGDFGTAMSHAYERIDHMVGDQPLVPTDLIRREAERIARLRPQTAQSGTTRELSQLPQGAPPQDPNDVALLKEFGIQLPADPKGRISFADAQRIRTLLREAAQEGNLTRGVTAGEAAKLANMVDYAIQSAGADPKAAAAVRLLNKTDQLYGEGIKKFQDTAVTKLLRDVRAGTPPDPEVTASTIIKPGYEKRAAELRKMVGPDVWNRVASADYQRLIGDATNDEGQIEGIRLLRAIRDRGDGLMRVVYGDKQAAALEEVAKIAAIQDGKLSPDALSSGRASATAERLRYAQERYDKFMKESALSTLANPKANPEQVYHALASPENSATLIEAVKTFGEDSPQIEGVRQAALQELLMRAKYHAADAKRSSDGLSEALADYSAQQQKLLFPHDMDRDLHLLGREISAITKDLSDESMAGMSSGVIQNLPIMARLPIQVYQGVYQTILQSPGVIRYLSIGLHDMPRAPGPGASAAAEAWYTARVELRQHSREALRDLVRYGTISPTVGSNAGYQSGGQTQPGASGSPQAVAGAPQ